MRISESDSPPDSRKLPPRFVPSLTRDAWASRKLSIYRRASSPQRQSPLLAKSPALQAQKAHPSRKEAKRGHGQFLLDVPVGARLALLMPRQPRAAPSGYVYHALNRAVARLPLFETDG